MPAWRRESETLIARALGAAPALWIEWGRALGAPDRELPSLVLDFVESTPSSAERVRAVIEAGTRLAADGRLVVLDHNRPRRALASLLALARSPWVVGTSPAARWRRLAYPTARELQANGWDVERLLLATGERVQIVIATRGG